jgi:hypothetical protein
MRTVHFWYINKRANRPREVRIAFFLVPPQKIWGGGWPWKIWSWSWISKIMLPKKMIRLWMKSMEIKIWKQEKREFYEFLIKICEDQKLCFCDVTVVF